MAHAIDHLVIGVADLDAAGAAMGALGFTVGPVNRHPWGTQNRLVQFCDETFLELIAVAEPGAIQPHGPRAFSFGAFVREALARRAGLSMLALKTGDAARDAARFAAAGIGDFAPFDFARQGVGPDGHTCEVAFTLAFAAEAAMPECGFFTCQHRFPENFWSKRAQSHANGAMGIARVTIVAENPSDHHIFLEAFVGERWVRSSSMGIEIETGHGLVEIVTRPGFAFRYGQPAPEATSPVFAGFEIRVARLDALPPAFRTGAGGRIAPHQPAFSTVLRFVEG